jgi:hypothetical protein
MKFLLRAVALAVIAVPATAQDMSEMISEAAGLPQIPAFLPDKYSVQRSDPLAIDGVWMISALRKKIRIEQGRAYAMDPWLHLFVLKIQPDMVVMQNFRRTGNGEYAADDLPLMGPAVLRLNGEGNLDVSVQGSLGPAKYGLVRLEAQYPNELGSEILAATGRTVNIPGPMSIQQPAPATPPSYPPSYPPQPAYQPNPAPAALPAGPATDCVAIGIDPDTGATICAE